MTPGTTAGTECGKTVTGEHTSTCIRTRELVVRDREAAADDLTNFAVK